MQLTMFCHKLDTTISICYILFQEEFYGRELIVADRDCVEQDADAILADAAVNDVAMLVVGDPFGATTHTDLVLRAQQKGIPYQVVHNASIMNAIGCCGLQVLLIEIIFPSGCILQR